MAAKFSRVFRSPVMPVIRIPYVMPVFSCTLLAALDMGDDDDDGFGMDEPPDDAADDEPDMFHEGVSLSASLKCFSRGMHPRMVRTVESARWSKLDRPRYSSWVK